MGKNMRRTLSLVMAGALVLGISTPDADAAKKVQLSKKKVTVEVGKKVVLKVKNTKKKAKWSVKSGKKVISLSKKKKASVTIKGKKAGKAVVQAKIGKKKLTCKVTVKKVAAEAPASTATATPVATTTPTTTTAPATTAPATTTAPAATTAPATEAPTVAPTVAPVLEPVTDIAIDLTDMETTFTAGGAKINFSSQIESRFDLTYFDTMEVSFTTEWTSDEAKAAFNCVKFGLANSDANLTGYDDGVALTYDSQVDGGTASVSLEEAKGTAYGINVQAMNADYGWPEGLTVTVTGITFRAKEGATYPDPNAPVDPTPTPEPALESVPFVYEGLDTSWIDPTKPMVAFTFDDGPIGNTDTSNGIKIQDMLSAANAHATFFYIGQRMNDSGKEEIARAHELGFEVGNHSYGWSSVSGYEKDELDESIGDTTAILSEITGYSNFLFRAPNLSISQTMLDYIPSPFINCATDSKDWNNATVEEIVANVTSAKDGDIILMHETENETVEALPEIIAYFQEQGVQIVSVSELFAVRGVDLMTGTKYSSCPPASN